MSTPSPYQIDQAMAVLHSAAQRLLQDDPEIVNDERLFSDMLEGEAGDAMEVLDRLLRAAVHAETMAEAADGRAKEITERRDRWRNRSQTLRGVAFAALDALGVRKRELPDMTATVRPGVASVVITDETALPASMVRVTTSPDKAAIGAALKAGDAVPGAELSNGLPALQIRRK